MPSQVYRKNPEPVRDLSISLYPSNSTAFVSWIPSTDVTNILFYQLEFLPKTKDPYCYVDNPTMTISASRTFAILSLPSETECEFEVALSNFDLHAREATAKQKFTFTPLGYDPNMSQIANLWLIIAPTSVVLSLCVILRFATYCHSRIKKWVKLSKEKKKMQVEKPVMV
uniref:Fibronectin type-III domain-containing protein n=1 Tax=Acrobeloides nanus TaxID=290746 RepID=A0A914DCL7_9BILA